MSSSSKIARASFVVTLLGIAGMFAPGLLDMDGFDGGFAVSMVSGFIAFTGLIVWFVYWRMSVREQSILSGAGVLARFMYGDEEWKKYTEYEHKIDAGNKKIIFRIIAGFALFFGVLFFFLDPEGGSIVALVMLGLIVFMYIVSKYTTYANHRRNIMSKGTAIIARDGIVMNGKFTSWNVMGGQFEGVAYNETADPTYLEFTYSMPTRGGRTKESVRVPVPAGQKQEVSGVLAHFS